MRPSLIVAGLFLMLTALPAAESEAAGKRKANPDEPAQARMFVPAAQAPAGPGLYPGHYRPESDKESRKKHAKAGKIRPR